MTEHTVIIFPNSNSQNWTLEALVSTLEEVGGDLNAFVSRVSPGFEGPKSDEHTVFLVERLLRTSDNKQLLARWEQAIRCRHIVRLRFLQDDAFERLEGIDEYPASTKDAQGPTAAVMLAYCKLVLGDFLIEQAVKAKEVKDEPELPADPAASASRDDDDLKDVMAGA